MSQSHADLLLGRGLNLTQTSLARLLGIPRRTVGRWARGAKPSQTSELLLGALVVAFRNVGPVFTGRQPTVRGTRSWLLADIGRLTTVEHWSLVFQAAAGPTGPVLEWPKTPPPRVAVGDY